MNDQQPVFMTDDDYNVYRPATPWRKSAEIGASLFDLFGRTDLLIPEGLADQTHDLFIDDTRGCPPGWRTFFSAPYVVTELLPGVVSVVLLTAYAPPDAHFQALADNVGATKLAATLVLARGAYWRLEPGRELTRIAVPPAARLWEDQGIPHTYQTIEFSERLRWGNLQLFGCCFGEADLGDVETLRFGMAARPEEVARLTAPERDGIPHGLLRCERCGEFRGECIDPDYHAKPMVVRVYCRCENDNRSPIDGRLLDSRKLAANYFDEAAHRIRLKSPTDVVFRLRGRSIPKLQSVAIQ
jgi:hypothetical protein